MRLEAIAQSANKKYMDIEKKMPNKYIETVERISHKNTIDNVTDIVQTDEYYSNLQHFNKWTFNLTIIQPNLPKM